jgi:hypothetical protein
MFQLDMDRKDQSALDWECWKPPPPLIPLPQLIGGGGWRRGEKARIYSIAGEPNKQVPRSFPAGKWKD